MNIPVRNFKIKNCFGGGINCGSTCIGQNKSCKVKTSIKDRGKLQDAFGKLKSKGLIKTKKLPTITKGAVPQTLDSIIKIKGPKK